MDNRRYLIVPFVKGTVTFTSDELVGVRTTDADGTEDWLDIRRDMIVGVEPGRLQEVLVLDMQHLLDAIREGMETQTREEKKE